MKIPLEITLTVALALVTLLEPVLTLLPSSSDSSVSIKYVKMKIMRPKYNKTTKDIKGIFNDMQHLLIVDHIIFNIINSEIIVCAFILVIFEEQTKMRD